MFHPFFIAPLIALVAMPNSSLLHLASEAAREVSPFVFQTNPELAVCIAEAERDLQVCRQDEKENCDGVFDSSVRLCRVRHPESSRAVAPPPPAPQAGSARQQEEEDGGVRKYLLWGGAIVVTLYIIAWIRAERAISQLDDIYGYGFADRNQ